MDSSIILARLNHEPDYRVGFCRCGCGGITNPGVLTGTWRTYKNGHASRTLKSVDVDPVSGCWNWLKACHKNGYGLTHDETRAHKQAHRMVWEWVHGPVPEGRELDHLCRNRGCVNPCHLRIVTRAENTQCGLVAKLNPEKVLRIRELHSSGLSERKIAKELGLTRWSVRPVVIGRTWRNIA